MRIIFTILFFTFFLQSAHAGVAEKDSLALVAVYDSTDGANWSSPWDLNTPVSSWRGITVQNNRVIRINLSGAMTGTLPAQITDLDSLEQLRFYYTTLGGQFPENIGNLTKLEILDLSNNDLEGTLPPGFYTLSNLQEVRLGLNNLSGEISSDIAALNQLNYLALNNNSFSGPIPGALGSLTQLTNLDLSRNNFDGTIPVELCSLPELKYLNLYWNSLSGNIPAEIGNLSKMENLRLANNDLEGEIPSTIGNLDSLMYLTLDQNNLSGAIPAELANCTKLASIRAGYNDFSGLPDLSALTNLTDIWIPNNQFSGPLPEFFYNMPQIRTFNIGRNNFDGELKADIANWQNLTHFYFGGNNFSGEIPKEVGTLKKVRFLELYSNNLSGTIPPEIGQIEDLQYLRLYDNQLTGHIPEEIGNAKKLRRVNLKENQLEGGLPSNFSRLEDLDELELSDNHFSYLPGFTQDFNRIDISRNNFTFEDIEPLTGLNISQFYYSGQDTALTKRNFSTPLNSSITLSMKIGGTANHYKWLKDGQVIVEDDTTGYYFVNAMQADDEGVYHCEISNDQVNDLTIVTHTITLSIGAANADSLALVDLYNATDGASWSQNADWLTSASFENWFGVNRNNEKLQINLSGNSLSGELPATIGNLLNTDQLDLSNNNLSGKIPGEIAGALALTVVNLAGNNFNGRVPDELLLLDNLSDLDLSENKLKDLPDFSMLDTPLNSLNVANNGLTFGDIEKNIGAAVQFDYAPQDSIGSGYSIELNEGESFTLELSTDGSANNYQWYHNNVMIDQATDSILVIENVTTDDSGDYMCMVTNDLATELTLYSRPVKVTVSGATALDDFSASKPQKFDLAQNYPNPFNPATKIRYALPQSAAVKLSVYNTLGQVVAELVNGRQQAGYHIVEFQANRYSSGLYFYVLETNGMRFKRKMLLIK